MAEIIKKCEKIWFDKVLSGEKKFELRLADWDINKGDILILKEIKDGKETGRIIKKKAGYIAKTKSMANYFTKEDIDKYGFQIIQLEDLNS